MQAQDHASGLWSLGVRIPGSKARDVENAIAQGLVLRTWPMRGTLHLVDSRDARWLLESTGARSLRTTSKRWEHLGLDATTANRAVELLGEALSGGGTLTRSQAHELFDKHGLQPGGQRGYHLLWYAATLGLTCVTTQVGKEPVFRLLAEWAPEQHEFPGDQAWTELARRYFRSHGPAQLRDFAGWAGITATQARSGIRAVGDELSQVTVAGSKMWVTTHLLDTAGLGKLPDEPVWALPGFDEFVLGIKDRSLLADSDGLKALVPGNNGVFRASLMSGGRIHGTWTKQVRSRALRVDVHWLPAAPMAVRDAAVGALADYATFLDRELDLRTAP